MMVHKAGRQAGRLTTGGGKELGKREEAVEERMKREEEAREKEKEERAWV